MPTIELKTPIKASPEVCFNLSLDLDLHMQSMKDRNEKAIGGTTSGQIKLGETVQWKARHFGMNFTMTIKIIELISPMRFTDEMIKGPFKVLRHQHIFEETESGTLMTDIFYFKSPLGLLGQVVDKVYLEKYMRSLLMTRNELIKNIAEQKHAYL